MTALLEGIDLVVFDKDGTLIEFGAMWSGWAVTLADGLEAAAGRSIRAPLFEMLGYDAEVGAIVPGGALAATPMARLRERTEAVLMVAGLRAAEAELVLDRAWHAPDPVALARPIADLPALFGWLRDAGRKIAVATSDDRDPTERTLDALGVSGLVDAVVCADDGFRVKPSPDMVLHLCRRLEIAPAQTAVVGDSAADLRMGRTAGAAQVIAVLSGVGSRRELEPLADAVIESVEELRSARS